MAKTSVCFYNMLYLIILFLFLFKIVWLAHNLLNTFLYVQC